MSRVYIDLVIDNGELVRIDCPARFDDALHDSLEQAMKRRDWWSPDRFDGCSAEYLGLHISKVNMARVVAVL